MENYLVSILVPVYNVEKYIARCAISLFEQTYDNIEYIFVDDCGTDDSIKVLNNVIGRYPNRRNYIRIVKHQYNRGLAAARNTAVEEASGDFLLHVDSDDWLKTDAVEKLVKKQQEDDYDIVLFEMNQFFTFGIIPNYRLSVKDARELCLKQLSREISSYVWAEFIRRSLYIDNDIKCIEGLNMGEDYSVSPRLAYFANKVVMLHEPLYQYNRLTESSYTAKFNEDNARQVLDILSILNTFFKDKGVEFEHSLKCAYLYSVLHSIVDIYKSDGFKRHKTFLSDNVRRLDYVNKQIIKSQPFSYYIIYKLRHFKSILNLYLFVAVSIKRILKMLKVVKYE